MVAKVINIALRSLEFLWTLLIMALVGNMIAEATHNNPSLINYDMFVAVFAMLTLFYLLPATIKEGLAGSPIIMVGVDVLNTLFFFCAAVAMAAELHAHSCNNRAYVTTNKITNGNFGNPEKRCREAQAVTAFLWFGFATFAGSAVLSFFQFRSGGMSSRGGMRSSGPSMRKG